VAAQAREQLEEAELLRLTCCDRHAEVVDGARRAAHGLQVVLTRYQQLAEGVVDELSKLLRQAIVFEASCLANEQYEAQTTFKVIEAVDKDKDLEAFIVAQAKRTGTASHTHGGVVGVEDTAARSLGLAALPSPPPTTRPQPPSVRTSVVVVLCPSHLPNLSAPAPNVIPSRYVLRLLRGTPAASPLPSPSPSPPPPPASAAEPAPSLVLRSPNTATAAPTSTKSPPTIPFIRRSPVPPTPHAVPDEDDEEEDDDDDEEDEGFGKAVVSRSLSPPPPPPPPKQQQQQQHKQQQQQHKQQQQVDSPTRRSLKEVMQKRHEKQQRGSGAGAVSSLVDVEEFTTEKGGKEYAL
jgi:hypothetical protein